MAPQSDKFRLLRRIPDLRFEEVPKGYSQEQVNRVLDNLAQLYEEVERLQARLAEAETRAASAEARLVEARSPSSSSAEVVPPLPNPDFDETLRNTLVSAQRTADTMVREAKEEAERVQSESELQSTGMLDDARAQAQDMAAEAATHRETLMSEAEQERLDLTVQYKDELLERKTAIEAELEEAHEAERSSLLAQISELQETHTLLQDDIKRFEEHLDSRREAIRTALADLNAVVEDPDSLRSHEQPEAAEIGEIDETEYDQIAIESPGLDVLAVDAEGDAPIGGADDAETEVGSKDEGGRDPDTSHGVGVQNAPLEISGSEPDGAGAETGELENAELRLAEHANIESAEVENVDGQSVDVQNVDVEQQAPIDEVQEPEAEIAEPALQMVPPTPPPNTEVGFEQDVTVDGPNVVEGQAEAIAGEKPAVTSGSGDPFLAELRRVTNEEPEAGDPITDFLEDESSNSSGGGWFGRRK